MSKKSAEVSIQVFLPEVQVYVPDDSPRCSCGSVLDNREVVTYGGSTCEICWGLAQPPGPEDPLTRTVSMSEEMAEFIRICR